MLQLTENELHDLTGYRQPSKQIKWLKHYGIRHFIAADGHPRVLRTDLETTSPKRNEPDFEALKRLG